MGSRRQSREATPLIVNLCGTDSKGCAFIERVQTANISRDGALLEGVRNRLVPGDVVVIRCEGNTGRFRVIWRQDDSNRLGLARIPTGSRSEDAQLPTAEPDDYLRPRLHSRRHHPRHKCEVAAELRLQNMQTPMWVTSRNLSEEGCSVQTTEAVPRSTELNIALWLGEVKIWAQGVVVNSLYGFGTGIRFTSMSRQDRQQLQDFLAQRESEISDRRQSQAGSQSSEAGAFYFHRGTGKGSHSAHSEFVVTVPLSLQEGATVRD